MATLSIDKKTAIVGALVEGASIRSVERMTGVHRDTITKLVVRMGKACDRLADEQIRNVPCEQLQLDEIWSFVGKKRNRVRLLDDTSQVGDFWTWVALDPDTKLVPHFMVGKRTRYDADAFVEGLAARVHGRPQISTDKLHLYRGAIFQAWSVREGNGWNRPSWGTIVKLYQVQPAGAGRYSPPQCIAAERFVESGSPDVDRISTSHVERQNLTMRMSIRRLTRLTNGFSKRVDNLKAAVSLHFAYYNFVRRHLSIKTTPAVASGVAEKAWTLGELVEWGDMYGR
jgi:IS1 family transposase